SDLPDVKLPDILKLPEIDMPNLQLPDMSDLPDVKLPDILKLPEIDMPLPALNLPHEVSSALSTVNYQPAVDYLSQIPNLFDVATFGPQLFWLLMVVPKVDSSPIAKFVMKPLTVPLLFSLVHLGIVSLSITADGGTAPIAEFAGVFDPAGDPQAAMVGMMKYPNFVTEEWSHVLTWDLWVGRWIWLDGMKRGVFTPHSVLLTNLIGPPGLLLHVATGIVQGKGFPTEGKE
ncbi:hypothetical protein TrRE_jg1804, partial [Triparma retinervis]